MMKHRVGKTAKPVAAPADAPVVNKRRRTVREVPTVFLPVSEFGEMAHMSKTAVYKALKNGELPYVLIAGQIRIPLAAAEALVTRAMKESGERQPA